MPVVTGRLRRRAHGCPQNRRAIPAKGALATLPVVANGCVSVWGGRNEAKGWVHETEKVLQEGRDSLKKEMLE